MSMKVSTVPTYAFASKEPIKKLNDWASSHCVYKEIKALFIAIQFLCAAPLQNNTEGKFVFRWRDPKTFFSLIGYLFLTVMAGFAFTQKISEYKQIEVNDNLGFYYGSLLVMFFQLIPILMILETRKLADHLNSWKVAQDTYNFITGKDLRLSLKKPLYNMFGFSALTICVVGFYLAKQESQINKMVNSKYGSWLHLSACIYYLTLVTFAGSLWTLFNVALQRFADAILYELKDVGHWRRTEAATLRKFAGLWLQLRNLTCDIGDTYCISGLYFMLCQFLINVTAIYEVTLKLTKGGTSESIWATIPCVLFLSYISECSHRTIDKVGPSFQNLIMERRNAVDTGKVEKEWKRFHDFTVMHPPCIQMAGYLTLNRGLNVSIFGSYVTYVVIFLQMNSPSVCNEIATTSSAS